jgi:hypothetical protein
MPDAITTANVIEFKANVALLMQQMDSRLRGMVTSDSYVGKQGSAVEQFGEATAQEVVNRHGDTPILDLPQDKRWVFPKDIEWGSLVDNVDKLRMRIEPTGAYTRAAAAAMNRKMDDIILAAFFAQAFKGENGTTAENFDTTNYQVAVTVGGAASSLNVAKLQSAVQKLLAANKGELGEPVYGAISSFEHDALLKEVQIANKDFGSSAVLVDGRVKRFMGVDFTLTERLSISGGNRLIPVWVKSGMHMGVWQDIQAEIAKRPDKRFSWQVYTYMTIGATRLESGKQIQVLCDDQI